MYQWEYDFMENLRQLHSRKKQLTNVLERYPKGSLVTHKKKNRTELYIHIYEKGKQHSRYLSPTRDKSVIIALQEKARQYTPISREIKLINQFIKSLTPIAMKIIEASPTPTENLPPKESENPNYKNQLRYQTARGEKVRSKSEKLIADTLFAHKIDYYYEKKITLNFREMYPDFTVTNPLSGQTCYWEHLGLDSEEYKNTWDFKKRIYGENHIEEGQNLIVTTENDLNKIESLVVMSFTITRYRELTPQKPEIHRTSGLQYKN